MEILLVEDDDRQRRDIETQLRADLPGAVLTCLVNAHEFYEEFERIAQSPPTVVIMDALLKWQTLTPATPDPPDMSAAEASIPGGIRCMRRLSEDPRTSNVPVILYTVLDRPDLPEGWRGMLKNVYYLHKTSDVGELTRMIRSVTVLQGDLPEDEAELKSASGDGGTSGPEGPEVSPMSVLHSAIRAVPAVRYALGVAGIGAAAAIVLGMLGDIRIAVFGILIVVVVMVALLVFARLVSSGGPTIGKPVFLFVWACVGLVVLTPYLLLASVFFGWPVDLRHWLTGR